MTLTQWEDLSGHAIGAAGILYFVALCCHLAEVAALAGTKVKGSQEAVLAEVAAGTAEQSVTWVDGDAEREEKREFRREFIGRLGLILTMFAVLAHGVALVARGMAAERVPWGNMYEFTLAGTFVVALAYLVLYKKFKLGWMAPLVIGLVVALIMVGQIWLYAPVAPLSESLNSYWLVIHVISAIIATGAFTLGGIASIMYLIKLKVGERETGWLARVPSLPQLDRVAYRIHAFAFPVWTFAVLITGPIWAHEAWSSYWSWDPKEVWAFITWVVYAGYLHARATAGWKGRNAAILALVGMATLWFNFIGINYFSTSSQHSYADSATSAPADISTTQLTGAIDQ